MQRTKGRHLQTTHYRATKREKVGVALNLPSVNTATGEGKGSTGLARRLASDAGYSIAAALLISIPNSILTKAWEVFEENEISPISFAESRF